MSRALDRPVEWYWRNPESNISMRDPSTWQTNTKGETLLQGKRKRTPKDENG